MNSPDRRFSFAPLLLSCGLLAACVSSPDRSSTSEDSVDSAGIESEAEPVSTTVNVGQTSDSGFEIASYSQPITILYEYDRPEVIAELIAQAHALLNAQAEADAASAENIPPIQEWEQLWDSTQEAGINPEALPLDLAPVWLLAATNTNRLEGCVTDWIEFGRKVDDEVIDRLGAESPTAALLEPMSADLLELFVELSTNLTTQAEAQAACES